MEPKPISFYTTRLRSYVPREAYKTASYKLVPMFIHSAIVLVSVLVISFNKNPFTLLGFALLSGISIACLFLFSHELSHGTIVKRKRILYFLECYFWAFSGFPPTVWKKVHNLSHHKYMNTYKDPDRKTFKSESSWQNKLYNIFIYPNKVLRYSFTVGLAMIFYSTKHITAVFYNDNNKPSIVTFRPHYTRKEKISVLKELTYVIFFWASIWSFLGIKYGLLFSFVSWTVYSTGVILFIITQHLKDPTFIEIPDPLLTTTSVKVHPLLDRLIDWHSYHVEHHLFPSINFDYYPMISGAIKELYPDKYQRMPLFKAVKEAYSKDIMIDDPLV